MGIAACTSPGISALYQPSARMERSEDKPAKWKTENIFGKTGTPFRTFTHETSYFSYSGWAFTRCDVSIIGSAVVHQKLIKQSISVNESLHKI
jgi:hypothetical protein